MKTKHSFALKLQNKSDAAVIPTRICAAEIKFESPFPKDAPGSITVWKYCSGAFAIEVETFTRTRFPHKRIKTFCVGKNKTEVIFNFAYLLTYSFDVEPVDYVSKFKDRGLAADLVYARIPNSKLYIPFAAQEEVLNRLESI